MGLVKFVYDVAMELEVVIKELPKLMTVFDSLYADISNTLLTEEEWVQLQEFQNLICHA